jgi:hypothetical protein
VAVTAASDNQRASVYQNRRTASLCLTRNPGSGTSFESNGLDHSCDTAGRHHAMVLLKRVSTS